MSTKLFYWFIFLLMIGISSCKTYQNIENVKKPKNGIAIPDTFSASYFKQIIPGDKIQVTDKYGQINKMVFSSSDETNVHGQIYIDPIQLKKVKPYYITIPIANVIKVKGAKIKGFTENDFKKILAGEQIKVYTNLGKQLIMIYKEVNKGLLHGDLLISPDTQMEITPTAFEIPLSDIEKVKVLRNNARPVIRYVGYGLAGYVIGTGLILLLLNFLLVWN